MIATHITKLPHLFSLFVVSFITFLFFCFLFFVFCFFIFIFFHFFFSFVFGGLDWKKRFTSFFVFLFSLNFFFTKEDREQENYQSLCCFIFYLFEILFYCGVGWIFFSLFLMRCDLIFFFFYFILSDVLWLSFSLSLFFNRLGISRSRFPVNSCWDNDDLDFPFFFILLAWFSQGK